jgi:hypothetical protein
MTEIIKDSLMDIGKSVIGVSIARAMNIPDKLDMGNSFVMTHGSNGALYALVSDVVDFASGDGSKIMNMDYFGLIDNVAFFSALSAGAEITKADKMIYDVLKGQINLSRDTSALIAESAILSGGRIAGRIIDETASVPSWLRVIRHPTNVREILY